MRTTANKRTKIRKDELRPEYRIDYTKTRPNRYAKYMQQGAVAVIIDPDVAAVFDSGESVNKALRAILRAMPESRKRARR
jgi:hypothetical protein